MGHKFEFSSVDFIGPDTTKQIISNNERANHQVRLTLPNELPLCFRIRIKTTRATDQALVLAYLLT